MDAQSYFFYSLAAISFCWGLFGLRCALAVLTANVVLGLLLFAIPDSILPSQYATALIFCWPVYWGLGFFLFRFSDRLSLIESLPLRLFFGCLLTVALIVPTQWASLQRFWRFQYAAYVADVAERPALVRALMLTSNSDQRCFESQAWLMSLAINGRDVPVANELLQAYSSCHRASATMVEVVRPLFDAGDTDAVQFLIDSGMKPSTLIFGTEYANGTAIAYAALSARKPELVRLIAESAPDAVRRMTYLFALIEGLEQRNDVEMLDILKQAGVNY